MIGAPRKHVASLYELSMLEQGEFWDLVAEVRGRLLTSLKPDGFKIGFSDVEISDDANFHAHVHIIPYRRGSNPDLPGGIHWVVADSAEFERK